jgi:ribosomal-protein-alanine N-acetyltransferase
VTPEALAALHADAMPRGRAWSAAEFAALAAAPGALLLCEGGCGFALGRVAADEAELLMLAVAPPARRRGVATRLLAGFEDAARHAGAAEAFLEVDAANTAAQALYAMAGYTERGRRPGYYGHADGHRSDALILGKTLS